jgi:hypothetical protein
LPAIKIKDWGFSAGERFGSPLEHFQVRRAAKFSARDGNGKGKAKHKGKGKEKVTDHAAPFPSVAFISRTFEVIHSRNSPFTP